MKDASGHEEKMRTEVPYLRDMMLAASGAFGVYAIEDYHTHWISAVVMALLSLYLWVKGRNWDKFYEAKKS